MLKVSNVRVNVDSDIKSSLAKKLNIQSDNILKAEILKKSIDARKKNDVHYIYNLAVEFKNGTKVSHPDISPYTPPRSFSVPKIPSASRPVVVGCGPAGLFCALTLAKAGQNPIVLERGKKVKERLKDIDSFHKTRKLCNNSNIQFGEGGAGTFSDGKLNTGIKSPLISSVLKTFVDCGAPEEILYMSRPHIGSDKLTEVIPNLRKYICSLGGEFRFETQLTDIKIHNYSVVAAITDKGEIETDKIFLATGHSARDIFEILYKKGVLLVSKPFAMGARIEHLQKDINTAQYGNFADFLPAADYRFAVHLKNGYSVYTFCMCPGGYISASASEQGGIVTNGYSNFARNGKNANSAVLVNVPPFTDNPLAGMYLQRKIEQDAFTLGGGDYSAPCQLVSDFLDSKSSNEFGNVLPTYPLGVKLTDISKCLPDFITESLRYGIRLIDHKMKGFAAPDALLTAPETRSSSPVQITRNENGVSSVFGLYPTGEGSGYAGGIMSSAVDGIKSALKAFDLVIEKEF